MYYYNPTAHYIQQPISNRRLQNRYQQKNGLNLTWENVSVDFKALFKNKKNILRNQYGKLSRGELVGLLGSSGSGKTTLLNALSFRKVRNLTVNGSIKVNGIEMDREKMLSISSYVQQEDLFFGTLTVKEHLMFHAMLRMDASLTKAEKENKVNLLIHELMLIKCQDSLIGIPGRLKGISGGEKKRLSFATEVLNDRMLLFCDEPTSGLDSAMAYSVVDSLKKIANTGKTVVTTIHQPSSDLFLMFDYIYVLYDGNLTLAGKQDDVIDFLGTLNLRAPQDFNPADFILDCVSLIPSTYQTDIVRVNQITQGFQRSSLNSNLRQEINHINRSNDQNEAYLYEHIKHRKKSRMSLFSETFLVLKRNFTNFFRDRGLVLLKLLQVTVFSLLIGITFLQLKVNPTESGVINKVIFLQTVSVCLLGSLPTVVYYPTQYPILYKENESRTYSILSYFLGNKFFEIPVYVTLAIIFGTISYWLVGLNPRALSFFISIGLLSLACVNSVSFGHLIAAFAPSPFSAVVIYMPSLMSMTLMTTFFLANAKSPIDFFKYASWEHYTVSLLLLNQWSTLKSTSDCPNCGSTYLDSFSVYESLIYVYIIGLCASYFVWNILAYIVTVVRIKVLFT